MYGKKLEDYRKDQKECKQFADMCNQYNKTESTTSTSFSFFKIFQQWILSCKKTAFHMQNTRTSCRQLYKSDF